MYGYDVVRQPLPLEVGEEGAGAAVPQQAGEVRSRPESLPAQVGARGRLVVLVVILQGEGEVEVVDLPDGHNEQLEAHLVSPENLEDVGSRLIPPGSSRWFVAHSCLGSQKTSPGQSPPVSVGLVGMGKVH